MQLIKISAVVNNNIRIPRFDPKSVSLYIDDLFLKSNYFVNMYAHETLL